MGATIVIVKEVNMTGTKRYYNRVQVLVYVLFAVLISGSLLHYLNLPDKTYGKHNSQHSNNILQQSNCKNRNSDDRLTGENNGAVEIVDHASLALKGTAIKTDGNVAYLSINNQSAIPVVAGDEIIPGLILEQVTATHIIVRHTQPLERLANQYDSNDEKSPNKNSSKSKDLIQNTTDTTKYLLTNDDLGVQKLPEGIDRVSQYQYMVDRTFLFEQFKSTDLYKQILIEENDGGGFILKAIKPGSVFDYLGFKLGDVVSSIDNKPVKSLEDLFSIHDEIKTRPDLIVKILRNNEHKQLDYFLN